MNNVTAPVVVVVVVVVVGIQEFIAWTEHEWCRFWDRAWDCRLLVSAYTHHHQMTALVKSYKDLHPSKSLETTLLLTNYGNVGLSFQSTIGMICGPMVDWSWEVHSKLNNISRTKFQLFIGPNEPGTHLCSSVEDDEWEMVRETVFFCWVQEFPN